MGVAVVTYPRILIAATIKGMRNAPGVLCGSLGSGAVVDRLDPLVSFDEVNELMGLPHLSQLRAAICQPPSASTNMAGA